MSPHGLSSADQDRPACLTCHRRKLKCSRESEGCVNCQKTKTTCTYPSAESRVRQRRGKYQKRKQSEGAELEIAPAPPAKRRQGRRTGLPEDDNTSAANSMRNAQFISFTNGQAASVGSDGLRDELSTVSVQNEFNVNEYTQGGTNETFTNRFFSDGQLMACWDIYCTNVDPLIKVIHTPSLRRTLFQTGRNTSTGQEGQQVLHSAFCFAVIMSLPHEAVQSTFDGDKNSFLERFKSDFERHLMAEQKRKIPSLHCLQGLVIYMACLRRQDGGEALWPLFGLALRMAQILGLDSDEVNIKVSFFEGQMRRRLWWSLCWLENKYAEDKMSEPTSILQWGQVALPLNLNDADFDPLTLTPPKTRVGFTDMTLSLVRFELTRLVFELVCIGETSGGISAYLRRADILTDVRTKIHSQHLQFCDRSRPFDRCVLTFAETILAKAKLMVDRSDTSKSNEHMILVTCIEILEKNNAFHNDPELDAWKWLYRRSVQLPSLLRVVSALNQENGNFLDTNAKLRALHVADALYPRLPESDKNSVLGQQLLHLLTLARKTVSFPDADNLNDMEADALNQQHQYIPQLADTTQTANPGTAAPYDDTLSLSDDDLKCMIEEFDWENINAMLADALWSVDAF